jgi:hypothetical protein
VSTAITAVEPLVVFGADKPELVAPVRRDAQPAARPKALRRIRELFDEAILVLLAVYLFPLIIIMIGAPIALFLRIVIYLARRIIG